jgi:hypothetical protein
MDGGKESFPLFKECILILPLFGIPICKQLVNQKYFAYKKAISFMYVRNIN